MREITGYKVIFADCDTQVVAGGEHSFAQAQQLASEYLQARIAGVDPDTPARLARLRLALLRITSADFEGDG